MIRTPSRLRRTVCYPIKERSGISPLGVALALGTNATTTRPPQYTKFSFFIGFLEKLGCYLLTGREEREKMTREQARETLKGQLRDYVESITQKSKGSNMYICPLCGSGTGSHGTGAFSIKDGTSWKCFSCDRGGDIFDLIGEYEGIEDYSAQLKRAGELFGIDLEKPTAYQNQDKTER